MGYKQVVLYCEEHDARQVAWIPTKFVRKDAELSIKGVHFIVEQTTSFERAAPLYTEELIREHRINTGDSLPKKVQ